MAQGLQKSVPLSPEEASFAISLSPEHREMFLKVAEECHDPTYLHNVRDLLVNGGAGRIVLPSKRNTSDVPSGHA